MDDETYLQLEKAVEDLIKNEHLSKEKATKFAKFKLNRQKKLREEGIKDVY